MKEVRMGLMPEGIPMQRQRDAVDVLSNIIQDLMTEVEMLRQMLADGDRLRQAQTGDQDKRAQEVVIGYRDWQEAQKERVNRVPTEVKRWEP